MQMGKYKSEHGKLPLGLLFAAGMFVGIIYVIIRKSTVLESADLLDEYTLYHMKYMSVDHCAFFLYVLRRRVGSAMLLTILFTTYLGLIVCIGSVLWYGISAGIFLSVLAVRYGLKGFLLAGVCVFPHFLLYLPAFYGLFRMGFELYRAIYGREGRNSNLSWKNILRAEAGRFAAIYALLMLGSVLESFISPYLVIGMLRVF